MLFSINHPEYLSINESFQTEHSFGGNQEWYRKHWAKKAGCGATSAANVTAYLAHTREAYQALYPQESMNQMDFLKHMEVLFRYVTPGPMGVNHVDKYIKGVLEYAKSRGLTLKAELLATEKSTIKQRTSRELKEFVEKALQADSPIAFLNLSRGEETHLQNWHWITITSVKVEEDYVFATASDEGIEREFDLLLWYMTTNMHGGLIYFE